MSDEPIILIPARLASTRLPRKPLADIAGLPMIVQVWQRAMESACGRVVVAAAEDEIVEVVTSAGGEAVLTDPDLPSGSDRIYQALEQIDPKGAHQRIVNMQGDLPTLEPGLITRVLEALGDNEMSTLVAEITEAGERDDPNVVKAIVSLHTPSSGRALYFTRATAPSGDGPLYHHIGIYAYQRAALANFVALPPSVLEQRERLEQLRALEAGMRIGVACVDTVPVGVDTAQDLELANRILSGHTAPKGV
ncbi:MAG: 3-deoxy-manno-octulosonate cytidylyltransferase [Rhizobiales bacterium TMED83]|nr:3-deoxy-manno-octulosonate cytidylyltransferase [Rhodobiaceae bacterium]RPF94266.1 MAG: 3-deoxy-manno-octulosonate cytidylyltransferase [Rhizobiales bacterium TMED83]